MNTADGANAEQRRQTDTDKTPSAEKADTRSDGQNGPEVQKLPSTPSESKNKLTSDEKSAESSSRWLGWFSSSANQTTQGSATGQGIVANGQISKVNVDDLSGPKSPALQASVAPNSQERDSDPNGVIAGTQRNLQPRSWLGLWSNAALPVEKSTMSEVTRNSSGLSHDDAKAHSATSNVVQDTKPPPLTSLAPAHESETPKSTGWAFWSRESSKDDRSGPKESFGKLALAGSPSQSHPESAVIEEARGIPGNMGRNETPRSVEKAEDTRSFKPEDDAGRKLETPAAKSTPKSIDQARIKTKKSSQNLILPSLTRTYRAVEKPSVFQQLSRFLQSSRLPDTKHVSIVQDPPRIKRALAIVSPLG